MSKIEYNRSFNKSIFKIKKYDIIRIITGENMKEERKLKLQMKQLSL